MKALMETGVILKEFGGPPSTYDRPDGAWTRERRAVVNSRRANYFIWRRNHRKPWTRSRAVSYERERSSWNEGYEDEETAVPCPTRIFESGTAEEKAACGEEPMSRGL